VTRPRVLSLGSRGPVTLFAYDIATRRWRASENNGLDIKSPRRPDGIDEQFGGSTCST
jgi:hypothetical protein